MACGPDFPTAPVPEGEGIIIYRDINFLGSSQSLNRDVEDLNFLDGPCQIDFSTNVFRWDDCISSVRVNPGWTATLYEDPESRGGSFTITADSPNLTTVPGPCRNNFNDCVSSIRISRR
jgi:hypothetical protein